MHNICKISELLVITANTVSTSRLIQHKWELFKLHHPNTDVDPLTVRLATIFRYLVLRGESLYFHHYCQPSPYVLRFITTGKKLPLMGTSEILPTAKYFRKVLKMQHLICSKLWISLISSWLYCRFIVFYSLIEHQQRSWTDTEIASKDLRGTVK